jgi:acetyl esterase/lipase
MHGLHRIEEFFMKRLLLFVACGVVIATSGSRGLVTPYGWVEYDIPYSTAHFSKTSLDLYIPKGNHFPVVVFVHGGSFVQGDRKHSPYAQIGESFQRRGFGCAVLSYRLLADSVWPAQPRDIASAIRWVTENIEYFGGEPSRVFVVGHSAGGHLAALVCTDSTYLAVESVSLRAIAGCVVIGAMMDDDGTLEKVPDAEQRLLFQRDWFFKIFGSKENFIESFPLRHIRAGMPPFLMLLADKEDLPKQDSDRRFADEAIKVGVSASVEIIQNRTHMGVVEAMVDPNDPTVERIIQFARESTSRNR